MEFWSEALTRASWSKLVELHKKYDFIIIGGWAAFLWTGKHKSKDIDIVVSYGTLAKLQSEFLLEKNDRLKKYEIKTEDFDIDIYVPHYSVLAIPAEELQKLATKLHGMKTVVPEALLILKQGAEVERRDAVKGMKDSIDILTLLAFTDIDLKKYAGLLKKYKKERYLHELLQILANFSDKDIKYLGMDFRKFKKWKHEIVVKIKALANDF